MNEKEKKKVARIIERFEKAKRHRQKKDSKWRELDAFDRGEQWDLDGNNLPPWIPRPVTNYVHLVKTTKRAALAIENPTGKLYPQGPNDMEMAERLQKVYEFEWDRIKLRKYIRDAVDTGKLLGTAIVQLYYDESDGVQGPKGKRYEGVIKARQIDPASFYPDPNAFTIEDCEYIDVVYRKPIEWVKKHPIFGKKAKGIKSRELANKEQGEIYQRNYNSEGTDRLIDFHEFYEKIPLEDGGFRYKVTYLAGTTIVHEVEQLEPNRYPFAIYYDFKQRQDFWGIGTCEYILDNQKLINKVESVIALIGTLLQNPQKVVTRNSGISAAEASRYGDVPGHTWVTNGNDASRAMYWLTPPQIPPALFNLANQAKENIREITGLTESYMGHSVGSLQTSSGVDSLIERSTLRDRDQMYDLELFIEDLSILLIEFITTYYTEERYMRIIDEQNNQVMFETFRGVDYKDLMYDVKVDVSAKAPISRARRQQEMEKLITLQGQMNYSPRIITPQEYIRNSEYMDSEAIIDRMNREEIENAQSILEEATQMMVEAVEQGIDPQQVGEMGQAMVAQRLEQLQQGVGSTSENAGQFQARQGGGPQI